MIVGYVISAAIQKQLSMMKNGEGGLSIFLGLDGTKEELGLKADNYWIFTENNVDELYVIFVISRLVELSLFCIHISGQYKCLGDLEEREHIAVLKHKDTNPSLFTGSTRTSRERERSQLKVYLSSLWPLRLLKTLRGIQGHQVRVS